MGLCLVLAVALAQESREVLCLFDSDETAASSSELHVYAEPALNFLGLIPVYRDVHEPLPSDADMKRYAGVVAWFRDGRMKDGVRYWSWIGRQRAQGRRVALLGSLGALDGVAPEIVNEGLRPLGLTYHGNSTRDPFVLEIVKRTPMVEFERTLDRELFEYVQITADDSCDVHLRVRRTDQPGSESDFVSTGPGGGYSALALHYDARLDRTQWRLNPFAFFARALGLERMPKMDLTTATGRRIFFATIDGDGLLNRVQAGPDAGCLAGEVVRDKLLKRLDLPVTASVIAADLDAGAALAQSIFALPNVEVAAHSWYHPLVWRDKTLAYKGHFSLEREVTQSVQRIQAVSPKPVRMFLWTGDCDPPEEAIELCEKLGIANMNGPDMGRGHNLDSLSNLRPIGIRRGPRWQFNSLAMSENNLTELWTRNFWAYRNILTHYRTSHELIPLRPIHVYFHYYVVEQPGGLAALTEIMDWAAAQEIHPMTATEYVDWVRGFYSARFDRTVDGDWRVRDYEACRTVRFDGSKLHVDIPRAKNVLGYRHQQGALYVHLAAGREAVIPLAPAPPDTRHLVEANGPWKEGRVRSRTAAFASVMTPQGPSAVRSKTHEAEAVLDLGDRAPALGR